MSSPFHEGEQQVQARLGVREDIEPWARKVVRPFLPEEHRRFYAQLPFVVLAARDDAGRPWATLLAEEPGFVSSPKPDRLHVGAMPSEGDALSGCLRPGSDVGLLGIELESRRRNRVNGRIASASSGVGLELGVEQSFGNCPQYITPRRWRRASGVPGAASGVRGDALSVRQAEIVRGADTFFISTGFRGRGESETFGMDASHRGGNPGFVEVRGPSQLVFPDYGGNNHFNTLGNLVMDPKVGIVFVDFERGDMLQLTGRAQVDWGTPEVERFPGARRLVHVDIEETVLVEGALPIRWDSRGMAMRELRVLSKRRESADVTSFLLAPRDGGVLPAFEAGQHLPIELDVPGAPLPVRRTYSLSSAPCSDLYRISVKREAQGIASRFLHDEVAVGDFIRAGTPQGSFTLDTTTSRPVVLVSAGVGLTPLVSMLHALVSEASGPPVWFVHGARDAEHHALRSEVEALAARSERVDVHVVQSRPGRPPSAGAGFHSVGHVDAELLATLLPDFAADFYLCGPSRFMADVQNGLEARGVPPERIHAESFGPTA